MIKVVSYIFLMLFLQSELLILIGQESKTHSNGERVVLFPDRKLYVTGERILFSASLQDQDGGNNRPESVIMYCELITPEGNKISGNKYYILNKQCSGYLDIPEEIITGIYYLRAYTRYMRNYGPRSYYYTAIKIINPYKKEVQVGTANNSTTQNLSPAENPFKQFDSLVILPDKNVYAPGDTAHLIIDGTQTDLSSFRGFTFSVVPEFSVTESQIISPENIYPENSGLYYTENKSLSITGKLFNSETGNPIPRTRVNLSILGRGQDFMARETDSSGRFLFPLPNYTGFRDLFICSEKISGMNPNILIDNDFCSIPVQIQTKNLTLTEKERETALNLAVNVQLESYYKNIQIPESVIDRGENQTFYGKPNKILDFGNYIQLPSLEDYFNEFPAFVRVIKHQGEKSFRILGELEGLKIYNPLVMVDLVAIDNPALVLSIQPTEVSRIEVVNLLYVKGDQTYGGIINIISKKGDFARINLPSSGIFINYKFLADTIFYPKPFKRLPHEPDTRNTIYWNPGLKLNKDIKSKEKFIVSDTPGSYLIILNAINSKGEAFRQTSRFEVLK